MTDVRGGRAYVDTDFEHVPERLADALGWTEGADEYTIDEDDVTTVANSQVRLRDDRFRNA